MSATTFFPPMVLRAIDRLETAVDGSDEEDVVSDARALLKELRHWEREWRGGRARLVVQGNPEPGSLPPHVAAFNKTLKEAQAAYDAVHPTVEKAEAAPKGRR